MLNQATADNIRNLNTHLTRKPRVTFDPAERRAALAANIDALCKKHGMVDPCDINAWVRLAMCYLDNGRSPATAYDETRKSIERVSKQLVALNAQPKCLDILAENYRNQRFIREAAQQRFIRAQQHRETVVAWLKRAGTVALIMLGLAAYHTPTLQAADTGAKPGPILAASELSKSQRAALNVMPTVSERKHVK